jgi:CheY-like chemotaxis protein/Tfp pilus assembly protein PilZ
MEKESTLELVNRKVLVVDDEDDILDLLKFKLISMGFNVDTATDGAEALKKVEDDRTIDLVLTDVRMPGRYDGVQLLSEIRNLFPFKPVVVLITGFADASEDEIYSKGASGFLKKPFDKKEFRRVIEDAIQKCPELKRRFERLDIDISAMIKLDSKGDQSISAKITNVAENGAFIATERTFPLNSEIDCELHFRDDNDDKVIEVKSEVIWRRKIGENKFSPGMGVRFLDLCQKDETFISNYIKEAFKKRKKEGKKSSAPKVKKKDSKKK